MSADSPSSTSRCPTCRSDKESIRLCGGGLGGECPHAHDDCPDPWHTSPLGADAQTDFPERPQRSIVDINRISNMQERTSNLRAATAEPNAAELTDTGEGQNGGIDGGRSNCVQRFVL